MKETEHATAWTRLCRYLAHAQYAVASLVERVKAGWRSHHHRMAADPGYVNAVTALPQAVVALITRNKRIQRVTEALVHAYVAIVRAVSQQDDWPPHLAWDDN